MNYLTPRRLLGGIADACPDVTATTVESMIKDSAKAAYDDGLDCIEKRIIRRNQQNLMDWCDGLGPKGALELLAAIAEFLPERSE